MRENPEILIFIKGLDLGGFSGGADLFGANLATEFHKDGYQVRLCICYRFNTPAEINLLNRLASNGIVPNFLLDWTGRTGAFTYIQALKKLGAYLANSKTDILHCHFHTGTLLGLLLKLSHRVKRVIRTAHVDHEWQRGWSGPLKQAIIRTLIFVIFPIFADLEVGVSTYAVDVLNQRFIARLLRKRAIVIPNGIPADVDGRPVNKQIRIAGWLNDHPVIGSVGRLEQQKGYSYLIEAMPVLVSAFPSLELWLIGDGPLKNELAVQCQELHVSDHIKFWGKQDDIRKYLSQMDVFVSPSIYEGLPTAVLEAIDSAVPCIVTDIPGTKDIVSGDNVLLVRAKDSRDLSQAIISALGRPSIRKSLLENSAKSIERFRIGNIARQYMEAYGKLR